MEQLSSFIPEKKLSYSELSPMEKAEGAVISMNGREISDVQEIDFEDIIESKGKCVLDVDYGSKELELIIEEITGHKMIAHTGIENVRGKSQSVEGETTHIYERVKDIVQKASDQLGRPIYFILTTYPKMDNGQPNPMRAWANSKNKGEAIFHWDSKRVDSNGQAYFDKTFTPDRNLS